MKFTIYSPFPLSPKSKNMALSQIQAKGSKQLRYYNAIYLYRTFLIVIRAH